MLMKKCILTFLSVIPFLCRDVGGDMALFCACPPPGTRGFCQKPFNRVLQSVAIPYRVWRHNVVAIPYRVWQCHNLGKFFHAVCHNSSP